MNYTNGRRYYTFDQYSLELFGEKVYKISINGNMSCPNRDGTCGDRGCIFCSEGGSGEFSGDGMTSVTRQLDTAIGRAAVRHPEIRRYIAYFQPFTNTYAPTAYLEQIFTEAIRHPLICGLSIATRPDCISADTYVLLEQLGRIKPVWIELGLQTIHEDTARFIRRGYPLPVFDEAVTRLAQCGIPVIVHTILGLPGEGRTELAATMAHLNRLPVKGIKLQLLHILKGTDLAAYLGRIPILTLEEYVDLVALCIGSLRPDIVIHRITGDGPAELLLAPLWSKNKKYVLNQINHGLKTRGITQGIYLEGMEV
ncbi:TIGR01212 family radical SAM protein [Anaerolentibacter hominis]|uniref:TIGR01212 family radical SAM protein n=1 Tax=Anaerolentibacter hominis TaxID=3079009 RepID=UPI0031B81388